MRRGSPSRPFSRFLEPRKSKGGPAIAEEGPFKSGDSEALRPNPLVLNQLLTRAAAPCPARHGEQRSHRGAIGFGLREGRLQAGYPSTRAGLERVVAFAPFHKHHSPSRQNSLRTRTVTLDPIGPSGQARLVR